MQQPTRLISTPFAQEGEKTDIQNVTGESDNSATYRVGFPPITMQSIRLGGKPPKGMDFNGVLFDITENISFLCKGGRYQYSAGLSTLIGGYPEGSNLLLDDNITEVVSEIASNQNNPNTNMTGWKLKPTKASSVLSDGNQNQQVINDFGGAKWYTKVGGYELGATVKLDNGDTVKSTVANNIIDPNVDMTGWVKTNDASQIVFNGFGSQEDFNKLYRSNFIFITDPLFGAVGDGSDESAKVQSALDYAGEYGTIYVPRGTFFVPQGLQLKRGQTIQGFGAQSSILQGDGSNVVIKTNTTLSGSIRYLRLLGLGVDNFTRNSGSTGKYAVQWWAANDSHIQMCELRSRHAEAIHCKYSYRGSITRNRITSSGNTFAFALVNNCNGMDCSNNTVSGGQGSGGGIRVGQTQTLDLSNTVIEVSNGVAVRIGGDDDLSDGVGPAESGGRCSGINLTNLYAEQCRRVLEVGLKWEVYNVTLTGLIVGNEVTTVVSVYEEPLHLGRVGGLICDYMFMLGNGTTALIKLYNQAAGLGTTPYLTDSRLISKSIFGYNSPLIVIDPSATNFANRIIGNGNTIMLNSVEELGGAKEYISAPIPCNTAYTPKLVIPPSGFGGAILSVEIIEATGALDGTLSIGSSSGATEIYTAALSTVSTPSGYAKVVTESQNRLIRATGVSMSFASGVATTTFRVRIRYRV